MNNKYLKSILQNRAEQIAPGSEIDLWPTIQKHFISSHAVLLNYEGGSKMKGISGIIPFKIQWQSALIGSIIFAVLIASLLASVPQARAALGNVLQRFGLVLEQPRVIGETAPPTIGLFEPESSEVQIAIPSMRLEEAQKMVPFPIPVPNWLPEGIKLRGVLVGEGPWGISCIGSNCPTVVPPTQIVLSYKLEKDGQEAEQAGLMIDIFDKPIEGGYMSPTEKVQEVSVDGMEAVYVIGAWEPGPDNDLENLLWNPSIDQQTLSWQDAKGFVYVIQAYGLDLEESDLIRIAESIR